MYPFYTFFISVSFIFYISFTDILNVKFVFNFALLKCLLIMSKNNYQSILLEICFVYDKDMTDEVPEHFFDHLWVPDPNNVNINDLLNSLDQKFKYTSTTNWRIYDGASIKELQVSQLIHHTNINDAELLTWLIKSNDKICFGSNGKLQKGIFRILL